MPFVLSNEVIKHNTEVCNLIIFTFDDKFTETDFFKFLKILEQLLSKEKKFAFLVDARTSTLAPLKCGLTLIHFMRKNKPLFKKYLLGSCLITNYKRFIKVMNWILTKQKPVSPNIITQEYQEGYSFVIKNIHDLMSRTINKEQEQIETDDADTDAIKDEFEEILI
jgi:hypothetical protein